MIVLRNLGIVKTNAGERIDIARQLNLQITKATSLSLVVGSKEEVRELSLGLSSFMHREDYVLSGQYLIDARDFANPLATQNRIGLESQVQVIAPDLLDAFNPSQSVKVILKFLIKQRGGVLPTTLSDELQFLELDESFISRKIKDISQFDRVKVLLLLSILLQVKLLIFESIETELDDNESAQLLRILQQFQINTGACSLFLTTDLRWALESTDAVGVLQAGVLLEYGSSTELDRKAFHPITLAMKKQIYPLTYAPLGCPYSRDCGAKLRVSENLCTTTLPITVSLTDTHVLRCHLSAEERVAYYSEVNSDNA